MRKLSCLLCTGKDHAVVYCPSCPTEVKQLLKDPANKDKIICVFCGEDHKLAACEKAKEEIPNSGGLRKIDSIRVPVQRAAREAERNTEAGRFKRARTGGFLQQCREMQHMKAELEHSQAMARLYDTQRRAALAAGEDNARGVLASARLANDVLERQGYVLANVGATASQLPVQQEVQPPLPTEPHPEEAQATSRAPQQSQRSRNSAHMQE